MVYNQKWQWILGINLNQKMIYFCLPFNCHWPIFASNTPSLVYPFVMDTIDCLCRKHHPCQGWRASPTQKVGHIFGMFLPPKWLGLGEILRGGCPPSLFDLYWRCLKGACSLISCRVFVVSGPLKTGSIGLLRVWATCWYQIYSSRWWQCVNGT